MKMTKRSYRMVVCVKQVPDTKQVTGDAMKPDGTINRAALPAIFNPEDRCALEAALKVRDENGGTVAVVTMGLPSATAILRESLMCGADEAYLVTDRRAAASDTLATSYILSRAVAKLNPDIVFCGRQAIDGDTAQVGPQIAEKLGFAFVAYAEAVSAEGCFVVARRDIGSGAETTRTRLPALLTVTSSSKELRPMNARRIMKFKNAEPVVWSLDDIGADISRCGKAGSPTNVSRVQSVILAGGEYRAFAADEDGVNALVAELAASHTLG